MEEFNFDGSEERKQFIDNYLDELRKVLEDPLNVITFREIVEPTRIYEIGGKLESMLYNEKRTYVIDVNGGCNVK